MVWLRFSGKSLDSISESFGLTRERVRQITQQYATCVTNISSPDWAEKSLRHLMGLCNVGNKLPDNDAINNYHPRLAASLVKNFSEKKSGGLTPERRFEISRSLNISTENEIQNKNPWTLERVLYEVKDFAKELGKPDLMPKIKDFLEHGRNDLRCAVGRFGGQSRIATLAKLTYQGQIVAPDGTRTYWTDERIRDFLHEVARKEGHPGVMPTQSEVKKHAEKPRSIITIFCRSANSKRERIEWFDLAVEHGLKYE